MGRNKMGQLGMENKTSRIVLIVRADPRLMGFPDPDP
jgi:hypothetical protein